MTLWILGTLVLVDGTLCGFRAAAGRNPRIFLWPYYASSMKRAGVLALVIISLYLALALLLSEFVGAELLLELEGIAARMVRFYGLYATCVLAALALYLVGQLDVSVLATVLILGPFTLVRPVVIVAGVVYGLWGQFEIIVTVYAIMASCTMLGFERALELGRPPWKNTLP